MGGPDAEVRFLRVRGDIHLAAVDGGDGPGTTVCDNGRRAGVTTPPAVHLPMPFVNGRHVTPEDAEDSRETHPSYLSR